MNMLAGNSAFCFVLFLLVLGLPFFVTVVEIPVK